MDLGSIARRLRKDIHDLYGYNSVVHMMSASGIRKSTRYVLRVAKDGEALARQTGLLDMRAVRSAGCPPVVGGIADAEAAWRGHSWPTARSPSPGAPRRWRSAAPGRKLRWPWSARRGALGVSARPARCAAPTGSWSATARPSARCSPGWAPRTPGWSGRNGGCAVRSAPPRTGWPTSTMPTCGARLAAAGRRRPVERALEILGDGVPDHLAAAGKLRVEHRQASLEELGRLAEPQMTKDAVAGRIRRLLSMADRKAKQDGIPDTESAVTPDLLDDA